jgi:hypothetical protein
MAGSCAVRLDAGHRLSDVVEWVVGASRARSPAGPYLRRPMLITPAPPPPQGPPPHPPTSPQCSPESVASYYARFMTTP